MLKTVILPHTIDRWEDLNETAQTRDMWKTAYKSTGMKKRIRPLATGENAAANWALRQANPPIPLAPNGGGIDELSSKDNLEDYFRNLAAAATNSKSVLEQLTTAIESLTTNNEKLVATNAKINAELTSLTKRMGVKSA